MFKTTKLRITRISFSLALVAVFFGATSSFDAGFCQKKESKDGVTVQKNSDGSVDAYDTETVPAAGDLEQGEDGGTTYVQGGDGKIHYRPGTSPYTKHLNDGTTVRRNSDGSIETWDAGESSHWVGSPDGGSSGSSHHRKAAKKKSSSGTKSAAKTTTVKKKAK